LKDGVMSTNGAQKSRGAVVITGTSTGIGRATAEWLAGRGFHVFAGVRNAADAPERSNIRPLVIDVTDGGTISAAAEHVAHELEGRRLRGLVNNAGISVPGPLEFLPLDDIRRQLEVNVIGPIAVTQAFLPLLRKSRGRIVNIGSIGGKMSTPFLGAYHISKYGMEALSDSLRMELRPSGIRVSLVEPGGIATPFWERGHAAADDLLARLPAEAHELYGSAIDAMKDAANVFEKRAQGPEAVARAIEHALTARHPKTRYLVGLDARAQSILKRLTPDQALDALIAWQLKMPKTAPTPANDPQGERAKSKV
jgi:NAD(P)-dependent dehydrogenase (short-subunit alcohol dehydrogenase family)